MNIASVWKFVAFHSHTNRTCFHLVVFFSRPFANVPNSMNSQIDVQSSKWFSWFRLRDLCVLHSHRFVTMKRYFSSAQYCNFPLVFFQKFSVFVVAYLFRIVKSITLRNGAISTVLIFLKSFKIFHVSLFLCKSFSNSKC